MRTISGNRPMTTDRTLSRAALASVLGKPTGASALRLIYGIIAVLLSGSLPAIGAEGDSFHHWAILAAPEMRESGVSDLLTAQLTAEKVELVEREQLAAVTREIELSKLLGADAAAQRLKVGQLAKADALVLLSLVEHDKKKFVKLVISDCRYGSRLRLDHFPFSTANVGSTIRCGTSRISTG